MFYFYFEVQRTSAGLGGFKIEGQQEFGLIFYVIYRTCSLLSHISALIGSC